MTYSGLYRKLHTSTLQLWNMLTSLQLVDQTDMDKLR